MNDLRILRVQIIERVTKLICPARDFVLRERAAPSGEHLKEIHARNELHHQKLAVAFVEMIADPGQRLMMKPRQKARFALELFAKFLFNKKRFLQSDHGIKPLIDGLVHGAHPALPQLAHDAISPL